MVFFFVCRGMPNEVFMALDSFGDHAIWFDNFYTSTGIWDLTVIAELSVAVRKEQCHLLRLLSDTCQELLISRREQSQCLFLDCNLLS